MCINQEGLYNVGVSTSEPHTLASLHHICGVYGLWTMDHGLTLYRKFHKFQMSCYQLCSSLLSNELPNVAAFSETFANVIINMRICTNTYSTCTNYITHA